MIASGHNPIDGYKALWNGAFYDAFTIGETIRRITPLILTGLAIAFAFRTGLFNIGAEGQVIVGWLAAVWVGLAIDAPMIIHLPLAVLKRSDSWWAMGIYTWSIKSENRCT